MPADLVQVRFDGWKIHAAHAQREEDRISHGIGCDPHAFSRRPVFRLHVFQVKLDDAVAERVRQSLPGSAPASLPQIDTDSVVKSIQSINKAMGDAAEAGCLDRRLGRTYTRECLQSSTLRYKKIMKILGSVLFVAAVLGCGGCAKQRTTHDAADELPGDPVCECQQAKHLLQSLPNLQSPGNGILKLSPGQKQLFLDNHVLARLERVERNLHQPEKYGPVIRPDRPWEGGSIQIRGGPSWNPREKFWMIWYSGGYATSVDGLHWEKPVLSLRDYKGSRQNNLMLPHTEYIFKDPITGRELLRQIGDGITVDNPYYDSTDPDAGRRYKAVAYRGPVCCLTGGRGMGFYPAVSPDGRNWRVLETAFIPTGDESHFFKDEARNLYVATVKQAGPYGRSVYLSVSHDFDHWTDPRDCLIFHADSIDQQRGADRVRMHLERPDLRKPVYNRPEEYQTDIYNLPVFTYAGLYIGMPTVFNHSGNAFSNSDGFSMVELAVSRDLLHWERAGNREKFIPLSPVDGERIMTRRSYWLRTGPLSRVMSCGSIIRD